MPPNPDGDALTYSIQNKPAWATFSNVTGRMAGIPVTGDEGTYHDIEIAVSDGELSDSISFSISVTTADEPTANENSAPSISGAPPAEVSVDTEYVFQPSATDPDGDALTYSIQNKPAWATFSNVTGRMAGIPVTGDEGTYHDIEIAVSDGELSDSISFSISVTTADEPTANENSAPSISGAPPLVVSVDELYVFQPDASDPDGDTLAYSIHNQPAWDNLQ